MSENWQFHPAVSPLCGSLPATVAWNCAMELRCRGIERDDFAGGVRHLRSILREWGYQVDQNPYRPDTPLHEAWQHDLRLHGAWPASLPEELQSKPAAMAISLKHVVEALGGRAAFDGAAMNANPYAASDPRQRQWEDGWLREVARCVPLEKRGAQQ